MPKKTPIQSRAGEWTMRDIYDMLMFDIEPELMTDMLTTLEDIYKGETRSQRKKRMQRYAEAFHEFGERFALLMELWKGEIHVFKENALKSIKESATSVDQAKLQELEQLFSHKKDA
jgi:hypothetical protein